MIEVGGSSQLYKKIEQATKNKPVSISLRHPAFLS